MRQRIVIAFLCLALFVYFALLARTAVTLIRTGTLEAVAPGVGALALPVVGLLGSAGHVARGIRASEAGPAGRR